MKNINKTKILLYSFVLTIVLWVSIGVFSFLSNKEAIFYVENSSLYKYYTDAFFANGGILRYDDFLKLIQKKDKYIYKLLKDEKIKLVRRGKGYDFFLFRSSNSESIDNNNYNLKNHFFSRSNVYIQKKIENIFYEDDFLYEYVDGIFVKKQLFNRSVIDRRYAKVIKCPENKLFVYQFNNDSKDAFIIIQSGKVTFMNSRFSNSSENIIKETLEEFFSKKEDTLLIHFWYHNIEDARCFN